MSGPYIIQLPFPPSVNAYWENARRMVKKGKKAGKRYMARMLSHEARRFHQEVFVAVRVGHRAPPRLGGRLALVIYAMPPKLNRRRDLDNLLKGTQDALTRAGVILDDVQFDDVRIVRGNAQGDGALWVVITPFDPREGVGVMTTLGLPAELFQTGGTRELFGPSA